MGSILRLEGKTAGRAEHSPYQRAYFDARTEKWFSRADVAGRVSALAGNLSFPRKALVFCFCRNRVESVICYLACLQAAHAVLLLDPDLAPELTESLISLYRPDFLLAPSDEQKILRSLDSEAFIVSDSNGIVIARAREPYEHDLHPDLAVLLSTSGSTGSPKLVRLSLRNIVANAESMAQALPYSHPTWRSAACPFTIPTVSPCSTATWSQAPVILAICTLYYRFVEQPCMYPDWPARLGNRLKAGWSQLTMPAASETERLAGEASLSVD